MDKPPSNPFHDPPSDVKNDPVKLGLWREYWRKVERDNEFESLEEKRKRQHDPRSCRGRRYDRNPDGL